MSAPTPAPGETSPRAGYYPDPSIPGYVRYWNGVAWVPGTSRPAPSEGEAMPAPPGGAAPAVPAQPTVPQQQPRVDETGPVFFDEEPQDVVPAQPALGTPKVAEPSDAAPAPASAEPEDLHGARPEPASAWQADAGRQSGFGGEQDRKVSWGAPAGSGQDPRVPSSPAETSDAPASSAPSPSAPSGDVPSEGTMTMRALRPRTSESGTEAPQGPSHRTDGTMSIRRVEAPAPAQPSAPRSGYGYPQAANASAAPAAPATPAAPAAPATPATPAAPATPSAPATPATPTAPTPPQSAASPQNAGSPLTPGAGGGNASWAQQVHQLAQAPAGEGQPVAPFKPVVEDPFLAQARAQAAVRPAGLGKRLAARLVDTLIVGGLTAAAAVPLVPKALDHIDAKIDEAKLSGLKTTVWLLDGTTAAYLGIVLGVLLVTGLLYEALPTAKWGRTLGKKLLGVQVRDIESHDAPSFGASLRRWLVYTVPGVLVIGVIGIVWCVFDRPWRQCWHDKAARTFVAG
ncbi:RDD family protein [Streptomyces sp. NPDC050418]|uniref:RDD family protein n=1 Tax=Streptomyces sp. NPDC050418 TaxID=3365612 RepID=UPI0037B72B3F